MQGGLTDLPVDGFLKMNPPNADVKSRYQKEFARHCQLATFEEEEDDLQFNEMTFPKSEEPAKSETPPFDHSSNLFSKDGNILRSEYEKLKAENEHLRKRLRIADVADLDITIDDGSEKDNFCHTLSSTPQKKESFRPKERSDTEKIKDGSSDVKMFDLPNGVPEQRADDVRQPKEQEAKLL